jgi:hypothetical protein
VAVREALLGDSRPGAHSVSAIHQDPVQVGEVFRSRSRWSRSVSDIECETGEPEPGEIGVDHGNLEPASGGKT